jgi:hypothetical protein
VRDTTKLRGEVGNSSFCLEGSQALPASPSDGVEFDFSVKYDNLMWRSRRYGGYFGSKFENLVRNVEFGYQLSIYSGTKENHGKP